MEHVKVGMFNLPGLKFEKGLIPDELHIEMTEWAKENHCGYPMNGWLWSFKSEAQRDWFILRWIDSIPKVEDDGLNMLQNNNISTILSTIHAGP